MTPSSSTSLEGTPSEPKLWPLTPTEVKKATFGLTPDQIDSLDQLRAKLPSDMSELEIAFFDDRALLRYLRARKYSVEKAHEMLMNTLVWRRVRKDLSRHRPANTLTGDQAASDHCRGCRR